MSAHLDELVTLKDVAKALHISNRSVFYEFEELLGIAPMTYFKIMRLQGVRRFLQAAELMTDSVAQIARRFGF
jgi:AraC family transcriptional regulator, ethanolamine operon transcriptional activator